MHKERFTVSPVAWTTPLNQRPPLVGIVIRKDRFVFELVRSSGEFGLSIVSHEYAGEALRAGLISGRVQEDKFTAVGLQPIAGKQIAAPLVDEAVAHLECAVERTVDVGDHSMLIGRVLVAEVEEGAFDGNWVTTKVTPLHYLGGNMFAPLGERFAVS
jgi:flavin reductase (DIM6/NTAB) family NADH-FMN oxidoreductase RutF